MRNILDNLSFRQVVAISGGFPTSRATSEQLGRLIDYVMSEGEPRGNSIEEGLWYPCIYGRILLSEDPSFSLISKSPDQAPGPVLTLNFLKDDKLALRTSNAHNPLSEIYDLNRMGQDVVIEDVQREIARQAEDYFDQVDEWCED